MKNIILAGLAALTLGGPIGCGNSVAEPKEERPKLEQIIGIPIGVGSVYKDLHGTISTLIDYKGEKVLASCYDHGGDINNISEAEALLDYEKSKGEEGRITLTGYRTENRFLICEVETEGHKVTLISNCK